MARSRNVRNYIHELKMFYFIFIERKIKRFFSISKCREHLSDLDKDYLVNYEEETDKRVYFTVNRLFYHILLTGRKKPERKEKESETGLKLSFLITLVVLFNTIRLQVFSACRTFTTTCCVWSSSHGGKIKKGKYKL